MIKVSKQSLVVPFVMVSIGRRLLLPMASLMGRLGFRKAPKGSDVERHSGGEVVVKEKFIYRDSGI